MAKEDIPVWEEAPELHHYTGWGGLEGIVTTHTLWATHFTELNDFTEIHHFKTHLLDTVIKKVKEEIIKKKKTSQGLSIGVSKIGGSLKIAQHFSKKLINSIYDVTFAHTKSPPFCDPFIVSFCNHAGDTKYERDYGLLSQWVGYGKEEAYAIVFDTKKLWDVLQSDIDHYHYSAGALQKVTYNSEELNFSATYEKLINSIADKVPLLITNTPENFRIDDIYKEFLIATACFKHRGFKDEREVRIFSSPHTQAMEDNLREADPQNFQRFNGVLKTIYPRDKKGPKRIVLLDNEKKQKLPIKRIIIGPHPSQKKLSKKVNDLFDGRINITLSETPYRPFKELS